MFEMTIKANTQTTITLVLFLLSTLSQAAIFTVNTYDSDVADINFADGICDVSADAGEQCTLRAAIMTANFNADHDTIIFADPGITITLTIPGFGDASIGDLNITQPLTITGAEAANARPIIQTNSTYTIFNIQAGGLAYDVSLNNLRLRNGNGIAQKGFGGGGGGAIRIGTPGGTVVISNVEMKENLAIAGGAIYIKNNPTVILDRVSIHNNSVSDDMFPFAYGNAIAGNGDIEITQSSIYDNGQPGMGSEAIYFENGGTLQISDSTISNNLGDGIHTAGLSSLGLQNVTVVGNSGYGIRFASNGTEILTIQNSIIDNNDLAGCYVPPGGMVVMNTDNYNLHQPSNGDCNLEDGDYNTLITSGEAGLTSLVTDNSPYGTAYHLPMPGSLAIDRGSSSNGPTSCNSTDQRGISRALDGDGNAEAICDIGAVEAPAVVAIPEIFANGFE